MESHDSGVLRVLYGVAGEGMGHATRSQVVIEHLLAEGHEVRVVASGAAFRYLSTRLAHVEEIFGPSFAMTEGQIHKWATVAQNVRLARRDLPETLRAWLASLNEWRPSVVVTDFEPLVALYARLARKPLVALDNIQALDRLRHDKMIIGDRVDRENFMLARAVTRSMVPRADAYVITTFFNAPLCKRPTTLVPPIVRPEVAAAEAVEGDHLVVYSSGEQSVLDALRATGVRCLVYGMRGGPEEAVVDGNLEFRPPSNEGFVEALRTARAVVAGGGFSLVSEAIVLRKPILAIPLRGQFEQIMNARYVERLGYGLEREVVDEAALSEFLERLPDFEARLAAQPPHDNTAALRIVDAVAREVAGVGRIGGRGAAFAWRGAGS